MSLKHIVSRLPHPLITATFAVAYLFFYLFANPMFAFSDVPWHFASGAWIIDNGSIPETDMWSYVPQSVTWYNISWLWDVIIAGIAKFFGLEYVYCLFVFCLALLMSFSLKWLMWRGIKPEFALAAVFVMAIVIWHFASARPYNLSFLLLLAVHYLCYLAYRKEHYKPLMIALPIIMALWGNIHGGFIAGFSVLGFYGIAALVEKEYAAFRKLFAIGVMSLISLLAFNYYHLGIVNATLRTLDSAATSFISEWRNFTLHSMMGPTVLVVTFLLVVNPRDKKIPLEDRLMAYAWLFAATWSVRNFPMAAILSMPALAISFSQTGNPKPFNVTDTVKSRLGVVAMAVIVVMLTLIPATRTALFPAEHVYAEKDIRPAIAYIKENIAADTVILNSYDLGGALIYMLDDRNPRVFIDGRAGTAYSEEILEGLIDARDILKPEHFGTLVERYQVGAIVVNTHHNFATITKQSPYNKQWRVTYEDDSYMVIERDSKK
jgi:hypothetical protein